MMPFDDESRRALETCSACPKLCRSRCPTAQAEASEVAVPTFKMQLARYVADGLSPLDADAAAVFYKCTGCLASRSECRHDVSVAHPLREARVAAVKAGVAPASIHDLERKFQRCGSPYSVDLEERLRTLIPESGEGSAVFAPSCASLARDPEDVQAGWTVLKALDPEIGAVGSCCGYPLYDAGLTEAFRDQARRFASTLTGREELVVSSPACAWTLRRVYPRQGISRPKRVRHIAELLDDEAARLRTLIRPTGPEAPRFLYHDACFLSRRLGVYDQPRRLLSWLAGIAPKEFPSRRERGLCSGAGANYRWTHAQPSQRIAGSCLDQLPAEQRREHILVSACPSARRQFKAADPSQTIQSLSQAVARRFAV